MPDPIYCYYHRHARLEIIQRHGQTYAVCPECRHALTEIIRSELYRTKHGDYHASDDLIHKLINGAEPVNPIPPISDLTLDGAPGVLAYVLMGECKCNNSQSPTPNHR